MFIRDWPMAGVGSSGRRRRPGPAFGWQPMTMQKMHELMPGFVTVAPFVRGRCTRHASVSPRCGAYHGMRGGKASGTRGVKCMMPSNVQGIPAERIPGSREEFPAHWKFPGVYGIYNDADELQYVAAVRDVAEAIGVHMEFVRDGGRLFAVRMMTVGEMDGAPLGEIARNWVMTHAEFDDVPPGNGDAAPEWRMEPFSPDVLLRGGEIEEEIRGVLRRYRVVLFMKGKRDVPRCGFSKRVVATLKDMLEDEFVCVDCLDARNGGIREGIKRYSEWPTIPQLYVDGEFVGGSDIVADMVEDGKLKKLLGPIARAKKLRTKEDKDKEAEGEVVQSGA